MEEVWGPWGRGSQGSSVRGTPQGVPATGAEGTHSPQRSLQRQVSDGFPEVGVAGHPVAAVLQLVRFMCSHDHVALGAWRDTGVSSRQGQGSSPSEACPSRVWDQ